MRITTYHYRHLNCIQRDWITTNTNMSNTMIRPEGFENVVGGDEYDKRITAGINGGRGNNNKRIHMTDDDPEAQLALIKNSVSGDLPEAAAKAAFGQLLELRDTFDALKTRNLQLQSRLCLRKVKKTPTSNDTAGPDTAGTTSR